MVNDYGFELLSDLPIPDDVDTWHELLSTDTLVPDLLECLNSGELARRHFREVARVAGLLFQGYPGNPKSSRQLQSSSGLLFDVFRRFDPGNLLLEQAQREVLERQLEVRRLRHALEKMRNLRFTVEKPEALTPLAFPIWASRVETQVSTENWADRIKRMALVLDQAADGLPQEAQVAAEAAVPDEEWSTAGGIDDSARRRWKKKTDRSHKSGSRRLRLRRNPD
jgi:ATP-dependent Lhr-like helicase